MVQELHLLPSAAGDSDLATKMNLDLQRTLRGGSTTGRRCHIYQIASNVFRTGRRQAATSQSNIFLRKKLTALKYHSRQLISNSCNKMHTKKVERALQGDTRDPANSCLSRNFRHKIQVKRQEELTCQGGIRVTRSPNLLIMLCWERRQIHSLSLPPSPITSTSPEAKAKLH